jgi:hypothetical protein
MHFRTQRVNDFDRRSMHMGLAPKHLRRACLALLAGVVVAPSSPTLLSVEMLESPSETVDRAMPQAESTSAPPSAGDAAPASPDSSPSTTAQPEARPTP